MPKLAKELSAVEVRRITRSGMHAVGGVNGLYINVKKTGARSWIQRVMIGGRLREIGLGSFPSVTLEQARQRARDIRQQVWEGIDPLADRRSAQEKLRSDEARRLTFDAAARECHKTKVHEFRNAKHGRDWLNSLEMYASPSMGSLPVQDIDLPHIVGALKPIWTDKTETATRVRQRIEAVLSWATVSGYRSGDNPARWKGNLEFVLAKPTKIHKVKHYPALAWHEVGSFMASLRKRDGMGARALEFAILTAARSGEVRLATWDEVDLQSKLWTIPGERMKTGRVHRVPLSDPVVALLEALPRFEGSPYVFPAIRGGALSDMSISAVCRRMKVAAVPHGFRSTFKDWCRSSTAYADEVSELALAHVSSDQTRAAYARDELLPKRASLMRDWATYLLRPPGNAVVTPIGKRQ